MNGPLPLCWSVSLKDRQTNADKWQLFNTGLQAILYIFLNLGAGLRITQVQTENPENLFKLLKAGFDEVSLILL